MTNWLPELTGGSGPLYQRLADRIEADIDAGGLKSGDKLPPQRDLAYDIGTTVGTVGRAYQLLRERGLVSGEVGRGTYVLAPNGGDARPALDALPLRSAASPRTEPGPARHYGSRPLDPPAGKIRFDSTTSPEVGQGLAIAEVISSVARKHPTEIAAYTRTFPEIWFEAGARALARNGFRPTPDMIVPTLGAHTCANAAIAALTSPGDFVMFEHVTYSPVARSAVLSGRRIALVDSDADGLVPESFDRVCAQKHPKLVFLMPTAHNPTVVTMPIERRREIAELARKHNVLIVEDDLYGSLTDDQSPLLAELAPERTMVVGGLSKAVAGGLRGGWLAGPPAYCNRIRVASRMLSGSMPFLLAETAAQIVLSGLAADVRARAIAEVQSRTTMARELLAGYDFNSSPNIPFLWLALPEAWNSGTFKNAAFDRDVLVDDEDEFKAGRSDRIFHRIRIGISAPAERETVRLGLSVIRRLLDEGPVGYERFD